MARYGHYYGETNRDLGRGRAEPGYRGREVTTYGGSRRGYTGRGGARNEGWGGAGLGYGGEYRGDLGTRGLTGRGFYGGEYGGRSPSGRGFGGGRQELNEFRGGGREFRGRNREILGERPMRGERSFDEFRGGMRETRGGRDRYDLSGNRSGFGEGSRYGGYGTGQATTDAYDIAYRNFEGPRGR